MSTSSGLLFRLILASTAGKQYLTHHAFARPALAISFSRLLPSIFSTSSSSLESGNVNSVALGPKTLSGGREVWALVDTRLQKWDMKLEGWEDLLLDEDVLNVVRRALRTHLPGVEGDNSRLDLELVDLAVGNEGDLSVLVSYAASEDENAMAIDTRGVRRLYAIVYVAYIAGTFDVTQVRQIPYQCVSISSSSPSSLKKKNVLDLLIRCPDAPKSTAHRKRTSRQYTVWGCCGSGGSRFCHPFARCSDLIVFRFALQRAHGTPIVQRLHPRRRSLPFRLDHPCPHRRDNDESFSGHGQIADF